jgi:hypothetical protein
MGTAANCKLCSLCSCRLPSSWMEATCQEEEEEEEEDRSSWIFPPLADHMQSMLLIQSTSSSNGFASQLKQLHTPVASCTFLTELNATCPHELKCFKFTSNPLQENTHTQTPQIFFRKKTLGLVDSRPTAKAWSSAALNVLSTSWNSFLDGWSMTITIPELLLP